MAGWGRRFVFGHHGTGIIGTYGSPTIRSSCMTTQESLLGSQFQYCNTIEVVSK